MFKTPNKKNSARLSRTPSPESWKIEIHDSELSSIASKANSRLSKKAMRPIRQRMTEMWVTSLMR
jgi:hypothetical protein